MEKLENTSKINAAASLSVISGLILDFERKIIKGNVDAKECHEIKVLKEKCCDENVIVSQSAFHGIVSLVERKIFPESRTISMLISLLPSVNHYGGLVSAVGKILLLQLETETSQKRTSACPDNTHIQHPFIMILKFNPEKSWFEIYNFVLQLIGMNEDIKIGHKIQFLRPIMRHLFWDSSWSGSKFQMKLFTALLLQSQHKEYLQFTLEALLWQQLDIHYCLFLQDLFLDLLRKEHANDTAAICGMTPALAQATKWVIINGYNPTLWLKILRNSIEADKASGSTVLYILTEVIMETPSFYINAVIDICECIILSSCCSKYVAFKFAAVVLNWFMSPSFLVDPLYQTLEKLVEFITEGEKKWNDKTAVLNDNEYYQLFGKNRAEVKFVVDLILISNDWAEGKASVLDWVKNLFDSNERKMQLKLHSFIQGMILCERDNAIVNLCLDFMFKLIDIDKDISFSYLCLLFYKLGRETDPTMQKTLLFSLPKLAMKKENKSLIVVVIKSLKRRRPKVMTPLIIQLFLSLWKSDEWCYHYLHDMLHDNTATDFAWEVNVSRAIALREIARLSPHLHGKDLVGVLSKILNECAGNVSGLPSAIAIEAVTELCKAYVIDAAGTWSAIQPKLRFDKRAIVIKSLCRFFGEIPNLNCPEQKFDALIEDIIPMLWNYTFFKDHEVIKSAFCALSKFPLGNLPLKLFPEVYRPDTTLPGESEKVSKNAEKLPDHPCMPAGCWIQFLSKIDVEVLQAGGNLVVSLVERELTSLPRGLFYLPPEKAEPLNYSYLSPTSICHSLVEHLRKNAAKNLTSTFSYLKQIISVLAHEYSKLLPPLNWQFLENFMVIDGEFSRHCITLLARQGQVSTSAKSILEKYFKSTEWNSHKLEEVIFIYTLVPLLCKAVSYNVLQTFLEDTIKLTLRAAINDNGPHFEKILHSLTETLRNKAVHFSHKTLIAGQLEKIITMIPPQHEAMEAYARCATEFPIKSIERLTSINEQDEVKGDWLRRAAIIKGAIAKRDDIKDPLAWLSELIEAAAPFPDEREFITKIVWSVIRERRDCDHRIWVQEFIWRIQASVTSSTPGESTVTLFLLDIFVVAIILLSGHDCLFANVNEFCLGEAKKLQVFPLSLSALLSFPEWTDMLPKVEFWLQKLLKWQDLPQERATAFVQALFTLKDLKSSKGEKESACLFSLYFIPC